jgi:hypothetical protein
MQRLTRVVVVFNDQNMNATEILWQHGTSTGWKGIELPSGPR